MPATFHGSVPEAPRPPHASGNGFITPPPELEGALVRIADALPAWAMEGPFLAGPTIERYRTALESVPGFEETKQSLLAALDEVTGGYAVVRLGNLTRILGAGSQPFLRLATAILAEVAIPFQPFQRWPLWKEIGTNLDAKPGLSTGVGYNAFHMDLVNATRPPDHTTLLCVRPDPLGAGASILADARAAVSRLSPLSRELLADAAYEYGTFFELSDVGQEFAPFPVTDGEPAHLGFVRFTAKMLAESALDREHARAAEDLAEQLIAGQVTYTLQCGDILIVNQHRWLHGREPLAEGQCDADPEDRRLLLQLFLREPDGPVPAAP